MVRGRRPAAPQPAPTLRTLTASGIAHEYAALAVRVGNLRVARGWTINRLSTESGINNRILREIEAGTRDTSLSTLLKLADVFKLTGGVADLFS
jgi:ribosome-binding protein aMBF1 (putative translation factor)